MRSEVAILKLVHHRNIIVTEQVLESKDSINIVTELVRGGELLQHIKGRSTLSEVEAYDLFIPVIRAIKYLHTMGIMHRDFKPENILCEPGFKKVKVADFGLGKLVKDGTVLARKCGTLVYVAPEVLSDSGYTKPADMWSIGVIMFLVLRGKLPFQGENDTEIIDSIENDAAEFGDKSWRKRSSELRDFVQRLLRKRPEARLTPGEALGHPWVKLVEGQIHSSAKGGDSADNADTASAAGMVTSAGKSMWSGMSKVELGQKLDEVRTKNAELEEELRDGRLVEAELVAALANV